jgi:hypothetical protein
MINGNPTTYVCRYYVCQLPATDRAVLRKQLQSE